MPSIDRQIGVSYGKAYSIPKLWPNSTIFVIGGGPSIGNLVGVDWLKDKLSIAIHYSILAVGTAAVWFCADARAYWELKKEIDKFQGLKISLNIRVNRWPSIEGCSDIKVVNPVKGNGLSNAPGSICYNGSAGGAAIDLAYHLGAKRIVLYGFDCNTIDFESQYSSVHTRERIIQKWQKSSVWAKIAADAIQRNVDIVNCTPNSGLPIIRKGELENEI